jgi:hypothetical protein
MKQPLDDRDYRPWEEDDRDEEAEADEKEREAYEYESYQDDHNDIW